MIVWLASYPKSGNTWVRLFLNCLLYSKNCSVDINKVYIRQFPLRKAQTRAWHSAGSFCKEKSLLAAGITAPQKSRPECRQTLESVGV